MIGTLACHAPMRSARTVQSDLESLARVARGPLSVEIVRARDAIAAALARGDVEAIRQSMNDGERVLALASQRPST